MTRSKRNGKSTRKSKSTRKHFTKKKTGSSKFRGGARLNWCGTSEDISKLQDQNRLLKYRLDTFADERDEARREAASYKAKFEEWFAKANECNRLLKQLTSMENDY